jgi:Tfp pilus assembly protein FimT
MPPVPPHRSTTRRVLVRLAEVVLVLVIIGLLAAIWMPGFYGAKGALR